MKKQKESALFFLAGLIWMFIEMAYFFIIACTVALAAYIIVSIIFFIRGLFKLPPENMQPETSVGLQFDGVNTFI